METRFGDRLMYIGGEFVDSDSGEWMDSVNPATGEVHGRVPAGTVSDVDRAVKAAAAAQLDWGARSVWERGDLIRALAEEIKKRHGHAVVTNVTEDDSLDISHFGDGPLRPISQRDVAHILEHRVFDSFDLITDCYNIKSKK